ncbi:NmrA family NAD(P)-binding protein [Limosilactobacillus sp. STM2_1]|uniref:NmrA family NAD(P)-binding protein n=1 Tax=Limosilactobacillus rudii TaxID=2759755 RepID=A0A7W3YMQ6_9LACO|nr:NmrA family NAD(P)-binding protein [Limosilactobacillus rudii]MBB1079204.1 NmrA family NAD(P)-binding protein [Limosilactobacillus rudii]MBB1097293.1 NmrA family NAD(P)-binding protein [Limosilactobacillus rudii]MCD7134402.1 NmrA family NAD(P)-binding protein [Limosilactobacillus rudii]
MKIMVTGASGGYGHYAINYLQNFAPAGTEIYGLVRSQEKANKLSASGVIPRIADYGDLESLVAAFEGIDRLLFVSVPNTALQQNIVSAIEQSEINYVAYTSLYGLDHEKFGLEQNHRATEEMIRQLGIRHTFLRNNWYLEIAAPQLKAAVKTGKLDYLSENGKVAWTLKREYAEVGARVILSDQEGEVVNLAGKPVTYLELAQALAKATGKRITSKVVSPQELMNSLSASGLSPMDTQLSYLYQDYARKGNNGEAQADPTEFEKVLGHSLTPLPEAVKKVINE